MFGKHWSNGILPDLADYTFARILCIFSQHWKKFATDSILSITNVFLLIDQGHQPLTASSFALESLAWIRRQSSDEKWLASSFIPNSATSKTASTLRCWNWTEASAFNTTSCRSVCQRKATTLNVSGSVSKIFSFWIQYECLLFVYSMKHS